MSEQIQQQLGTSISRGTKVTSDPRASSNPIEEGTGIVTSDSLAAESIRSGGDFGANTSDKVGISNQPSKGFTGNTKDVSGARKIEPDAGLDDEPTQQADLDSALKLGKSAGVGPTYNADSTQKGTTSSAGVAPSIYQDNVDERIYQPKGENLKEGGDIKGNEKNTSFTADIGSEDDPSLLAEEKMRRQNADQAAAIGGFGKETGVDEDKGGFEKLDETSA